MRKCVDLILSNDFCRRYFVNENTDRYELLHQIPIYFEIELDGKKEEAKALLDGIRIDHTEKTIQPFDLKTTGKSVWDFEGSFIHFGYYRQAA